MYPTPLWQPTWSFWCSRLHCVLHFSFLFSYFSFLFLVIKMQLKVIKIPCVHSHQSALRFCPRINSWKFYLWFTWKYALFANILTSLSQVTHNLKIQMKSYWANAIHQICLTDLAALNQETNFTFLKYSCEDQNARAIILCVLYRGRLLIMDWDPIMDSL